MTCHATVYTLPARPSPYTHCDRCHASLQDAHGNDIPGVMQTSDGWFCSSRCWTLALVAEQKRQGETILDATVAIALWLILILVMIGGIFL